MSKSGEILRIGHANYSFLCSHCGFNFHDINEILAHIDYHFDILESKGIHTNDTNIFNGCASVQPDVEDFSSVEKLSVDKILNCDGIRTEFKIEESREAKTYVGELPLDVKLVEEAKTVDGSRSNRRRAVATRKRTSTKDATVNVEVNNHSCPICESEFDSTTDCKNHLRDVHNMSNKVYQCYICGYFCKSVTKLKRHFRTGFHSKVSNCYQCESQPAIRNEWDARPHKCCLCSSWYENHGHFRKHFKDDHQEDVEKFFTKKANCSEYTCYICRKDFLHKYYLRNHMIIHDELKAFVCDVCGKCYRTR